MILVLIFFFFVAIVISGGKKEESRNSHNEGSKEPKFFERIKSNKATKVALSLTKWMIFILLILGFIFLLGMNEQREIDKMEMNTEDFHISVTGGREIIYPFGSQNIEIQKAVGKTENGSTEIHISPPDFRKGSREISFSADGEKYEIESYIFFYPGYGYAEKKKLNLGSGQRNFSGQFDCPKKYKRCSVVLVITLPDDGWVKMVNLTSK